MNSGVFLSHSLECCLFARACFFGYVKVEGAVQGGSVRLGDDAVAPVGLNCRLFAGMQLTCSSSRMLAAPTHLCTQYQCVG